MFCGQRIAVVMPAYNVESHIAAAVEAVPEFVDDIIVVNDASVDRTAQAVHDTRSPRAILLHHQVNLGVGAAISTGYREALRRGAQAVAVMAGDGQMDSDDLPALLRPIVDGKADYVKGNRFRRPEVWRVMPLQRLCGNIFLSLLTKLTSGYWRLFDSQCGYTSISSSMLERTQCQLYPRYGYLNDLLARLKVERARVVEVPVRPIYGDEPSGIRISTVFYPILYVLSRSLARRLYRQYLQPLLSVGRRSLTERP